MRSDNFAAGKSGIRVKVLGQLYMTTGDTLFRVSTPGFTAAVIVREGVVMQAAPILRHYVGLHWQKVRYELRRRHGENLDLENLSGGSDHDDT